jgi:hypothetical protein
MAFAAERGLIRDALWSCPLPFANHKASCLIPSLIATSLLEHYASSKYIGGLIISNRIPELPFSLGKTVVVASESPAFWGLHMEPACTPLCCGLHRDSRAHSSRGAPVHIAHYMTDRLHARLLPWHGWGSLVDEESVRRPESLSSQEGHWKLLRRLIISARRMKPGGVNGAMLTEPASALANGEAGESK